MNDGHRRTFETSSGGVEVESPLLRAVLSYAPCDDGAPVPVTEWISLSSDTADDEVVRMRLTCAPQLGDGVPGPFGSRFYAGDHFEVVVPRRTEDHGALLMLNLLDASAPTRFEFDTDMPDGWSVRVERDGSVTFIDGDGESRIYIGAAWAFDSESARVRTGYTFEAGKLVHNVATTETTRFPVLVDPDPDAIFTADGHLVVDSWEPWFSPDGNDIVLPGS